jgi:1-aminocyclopropane-1-carboxylate deaminase
MLPYKPTPLTPIELPEAARNSIRILVKREDLNNPEVSGNKWWKLKYNLAEAERIGAKTILTFGGAYSNHIYSTAAAAGHAGFNSIGIVRGEEIQPLNPTLQFARDRGMHLHFISREEYKRKSGEDFIKDLHRAFGDFYLIPEGGSNALGIQGCVEFATTELSRLSFDYLILPVGTGATMAGIIIGLRNTKKVIGIPVLKNAEFLKRHVQKYLEDFSCGDYGNWELLTSYHHGGYAKVTDELLRFIVMMQAQHNLPFDPVYTAKAMWATINQTEKGAFARGSTVLFVHTGGLQGASNALPR